MACVCESQAANAKVIKSDIDSVWKAFRGFGPSILSFWSDAYSNVELDGEDEVGVVRTLTTLNGNVIEEKLLTRDDDEHYMEYSLVSRKWDNGLLQATYKVQMQSQSSATLVCCNCDFEATDETSAKAIKHVLEASTFGLALSGLEDLLDPAVTELNIRRISAELDMPGRENAPETFVQVSIKDRDGSFQEIGTTEVNCNMNKPKWNHSFIEFVRESFSAVHFTVFERISIGIEELLFCCEISVEDIKLKGSGNVFEISAKPLPSQKIQCKIVLEDLVGLAIPTEDKVITNPRTVTESGLRFMALLDNLKSYFTENVINGMDGTLQLEYKHATEYKPHIDPTDLPGSYKHLPNHYKREPKMFAHLYARILECVFAFSDFCKNREDGVIKWTAFFSDVHFPMSPTVNSVVESWQSDYEFCRQFLQGINPFLIKLVEDISEVPEDMQSLEMFDEDDGNMHPVSDLITEKRLLIVDYDALANVTNPAPAGYYPSSAVKSRNVFYAPYVLMYRTMSEPSQTGHNLKPLGIQLTRLEEGNKVFTPSTNEKTEASTDLQWLYAKILVQNADAIVMEFIHHLGIGHLALEPVIIAYFNWVHSSNPDPKNEAIIKMLEPHMDKTLAINDLARHSLVAKKNSTTDTLISTGTFFGVKAFANKYRTLEYSDFCFPKQVEKRGFVKDGSEGIKGYFFRDDGYQMWDALYQYANSAVNHCYETDEDVVENSELQNFFSEMSSPDKGNFVPFRNLEVDSKEKLTEALTCIIFQASAYHAVQNNAQFDYFGFVPNKPLAVTYQAIDDPDLTMEKIHRSLPDQQNMLKQMILTYALSCPTTDNLCDLHALKELVPEAHGNLMESFGTLEKSIGDRNCECHDNNEIPYPYFLPSTCNVSVNM